MSLRRSRIADRGGDVIVATGRSGCRGVERRNYAGHDVAKHRGRAGRRYRHRALRFDRRELRPRSAGPASTGEFVGDGDEPGGQQHLSRLVAARPENEGHVANSAEGGAPASRLAGQAESAMSTVPTPQLVIIQTIDGDLQCPLDASALAAFGETLADVLDQIVTASPESQILMVGQWGRPIAAGLEDFVASHPEVMPELTGTGENCNGFFDPSGALVQETFDLLNASIDAYEGEQLRRCGAVPQCRTDGGVRANHTQVEGEVSSDGDHLNVRGQASAAELVWPVVVEMLGLDDAAASSPCQQPNSKADTSTSRTIGTAGRNPD